MEVLYVCSEVAPFAKTGGLADVSGALPKALADLGHDVRVAVPFYRDVGESGIGVCETDISLAVPIMDRQVAGGVLEGRLPGSDVPVYFIRNDHYFDRRGLYGDPDTGRDYDDNCERFVFFSRAALELCDAIDYRPDVIHAHDWQAGLVPAYVRTLYSRDRAVSGARTVFTVHNLGYQGIFWHWDMKLTGLSWELFNWQQLEFYGNLNCLKAGLVFADLLTTVSRRYAQEIQTEEYGCGLEGVLAERSEDLYGVVNGVDYGVWDPATDPFIASGYSRDDRSGKAECKKALLDESGLPQDEQVPVVGMVSRLAAQKGLDILTVALDEVLALDLRMVILGTGDRKYHKLLEDAARKHPDRLAVHLTFDEPLAHRIEAGADMLLMPSRYEPCGLNQLYALKYGTVPVVRAAGGLADTVVDCTADTLADGSATGFAFESYDPVELLLTLERALRVFGRRRDWERLVRTGMEQDWSWHRSAREYSALYERALGRPAG